MPKKNELSEINKTLRLILKELIKMNSKENGRHDNEEGLSEDELYEKAKELVKGLKKISASLLQRKLWIGYAKAAYLLDKLEEDGIIGAPDGISPRKVLKRK